MDLNARVNCGQKDGRPDGWTENLTPLSHLAKACATKKTKTLFYSPMNMVLLASEVKYKLSTKL